MCIMTINSKPEPKMVLRFQRTTYQPDDLTYDIVYTDRLTGKVVLQYDGADLANTSAAYGAISDKECLRRKGLNIDEEIDIDRSVIKVDQGEVDHLILIKAEKAKRAEEEEAAQDILKFLGKDAEKYDFAKWYLGEDNILRPALEKRGYKAIVFYMIEEDSFGPLMRGIVATDPNGNRVRFYCG